MSQRARVGIILGIIGLLLAVLGFFALYTLIRRSFAPQAPPTPPPAVRENVIVASRSIPLGTVIAAEDLNTVQMPIEFIPDGAVQNPDLAIGRFVKTDLVEGEFIMTHHLADPTNVTGDIGFAIGDNQVLMAFPAVDLMSSLSVLQRGDIIDIFATIDQEVAVPEDEIDVVTEGEEAETETRTFTFDAFQRISITAMVVEVVQQQNQQGAVPGQPQQPQQQQAGRVLAYLFALDPQDALTLKYLNDTGANFDLVLRAPTSDLFFDVSPVTEEFINDLYQFEELP